MKKLFVVFFMFIFAMTTALVSNAQEQQNETNAIEMSKNDVNATVNSSKYENSLKKENIRKESDYKQLEAFISRTYTLERDIENQCTYVADGYFGLLLNNE